MGGGPVLSSCQFDHYRDAVLPDSKAKLTPVTYDAPASSSQYGKRIQSWKPFLSPTTSSKPRCLLRSSGNLPNSIWTSKGYQHLDSQQREPGDCWKIFESFPHEFGASRLWFIRDSCRWNKQPKKLQTLMESISIPHARHASQKECN